MRTFAAIQIACIALAVGIAICIPSSMTETDSQITAAGVGDRT
ncbi:hypothetical protein AB4225_27360 [Streptomyces sp. 2RAF24]